MSLQTRIESLVLRLAAEFKSLHSQVGPLAHLSTTDQASLVAAINELRGQIQQASAALIDDFGENSATTSTFSAFKIISLLDSLRADLLGGADGAFDTLKELQDAVLQDQSGLASLLTALDARLRVDGPQDLNATAQAQARNNIGAVALSEIGDPETDWVAQFEAALLGI